MCGAILWVRFRQRSDFAFARTRLMCINTSSPDILLLYSFHLALGEKLSVAREISEQQSLLRSTSENMRISATFVFCRSPCSSKCVFGIKFHGIHSRLRLGDIKSSIFYVSFYSAEGVSFSIYTSWGFQRMTDSNGYRYLKMYGTDQFTYFLSYIAVTVILVNRKRDEKNLILVYKTKFVFH